MILNKKDYNPTDENLIDKQDNPTGNGYARPPEDPACIVDYFHVLGFVEDRGEMAVAEMRLMLSKPEIFFAYWRGAGAKEQLLPENEAVAALKRGTYMPGIHGPLPTRLIDTVGKLDDKLRTSFDDAIDLMDNRPSDDLQVKLGRIHDAVLQFAPRFSASAWHLATLFTEIVKNAKKIEMGPGAGKFRDVSLTMQLTVWIVQIEEKIVDIARYDPSSGE